MSTKILAVAIGACAAVAAATSALGQMGPEGPEAEGVTGLVPSFKVTMPADSEIEPVSGRMTLYMINDASGIGQGMKPANGPFWDRMQPMYGVDVEDFGPGDSVIIDGEALGWPGPLDELEEGSYRVQAVLDVNRSGSNWLYEDGNYFTDAWRYYLPGPDGAIEASVMSRLGAELSFPFEIALTRRTKPQSFPELRSLSFFEVKSEILSEHFGRDVMLHAGVIEPTIRRVGREYPTVYDIHGYGVDHKYAWRLTRWREQMPGFNTSLNRSVYRVLIGADGMWGHNLLANSENNGPVMDAVVQELIPALEEKYPLIPEKDARLLWGASSGGWAAIWLQMHHPEFFGAAWAMCPDPVDFTAFQDGINIYESENAYVDASGDDVAGYRKDGETKFSVRTENLIEEIMGAAGTSAQQWDSWNAVFGPKGEDGAPAPLFDWETGAIDADVAKAWRAYDIAHLVKTDPARFGPIFRDQIRIVVGEDDNYFLNRAVESLQSVLEETGYLSSEDDEFFGSVRIVEDADHFVIQDWAWKATVGEEIYDFMQEAGVRDRKVEEEE